MEKYSYGYFSRLSANSYITHLVERGKTLCNVTQAGVKLVVVSEEELGKFPQLCQRCMTRVETIQKAEIDDLVNQVKLKNYERDIASSHELKRHLIVKFHGSRHWGYLKEQLEKVW